MAQTKKLEQMSRAHTTSAISSQRKKEEDGIFKKVKVLQKERDKLSDKQERHHHPLAKKKLKDDALSLDSQLNAHMSEKRSLEEKIRKNELTFKRNAKTVTAENTQGASQEEIGKLAMELQNKWEQMEKLKMQLEKAIKVKEEQNSQIMDMEKKVDKMAAKHNKANKSKLDDSSGTLAKPTEKLTKLRERIEDTNRKLEITNKHLLSNNKMFKSKVMELEATKTSLRSTIAELNREMDRLITDSNNQKMNVSALVRTAAAQGHDRLAVLASVQLTDKDLLMSSMRKNPSQRSLTLDREDKRNSEKQRVLSSDRDRSKNNSPAKLEYFGDGINLPNTGEAPSLRSSPNKTKKKDIDPDEIQQQIQPDQISESKNNEIIQNEVDDIFLTNREQPVIDKEEKIEDTQASKDAKINDQQQLEKQNQEEMNKNINNATSKLEKKSFKFKFNKAPKNEPKKNEIKIDNNEGTIFTDKITERSIKEDLEKDLGINVKPPTKSTNV